MHEPAHHTRLGEALQVGAGLAQLDPDALHVAHEEALPDQRVEPRTTRVDLAAALARA